MNRFLAAVVLAVGSLALPDSAADEPTRRPHVLLRSGWQTVNIGDIAHTPGVLKLLEDHVPEARVTLWSGKLDRGVDELMRRNFPKVPIVSGEYTLTGKASNPELGKAIADADFFLHSSGPSLVAAKHLTAWKANTSKPYGIYGITVSAVTEETRPLFDHARFAYFRDTISLKLAQKEGLKSPRMEFGPDGAFAVTLRNDEKAIAFLKANGLEEGKFLCAIPRLRYTPYWKIRNKEMTDEDRRKAAVNEKLRDSDHAKLREAIIAFVRQTGMKVLVCPEDVSHMEVGKQNLVDPLPADVRAKVVWREAYWLTDEAVSVYVRSIGLLSMDMHSPIMCIGNGIPAIFCFFKEQTSKPQMWRDIGLGEWLFDLDEEADGRRITAALLTLVSDPTATRTKVARAQGFVRERQERTMAVVREELRRAISPR